MRLFQYVLPLAASALFLACTPSPEKVCGHLMDVAAKDSKADKDKSSDKDKDKAKQDCTDSLQKVKDSDPDKYKDCSKCMMDADDVKSIGTCMGKDFCQDKKDKKKDKKGDDDSDK